jgi:hypothetical protein
LSACVLVLRLLRRTERSGTRAGIATRFSNFGDFGAEFCKIRLEISQVPARGTSRAPPADAKAQALASAFVFGLDA